MYFVFPECPAVSFNGFLSLVQFQDPDFGGLSGGRVVRIAVHPDYQGVKYLGGTQLWEMALQASSGQHCSSSSF